MINELSSRIRSIWNDTRINYVHTNKTIIKISNKYNNSLLAIQTTKNI